MWCPSTYLVDYMRRERSAAILQHLADYMPPEKSAGILQSSFMEMLPVYIHIHTAPQGHIHIRRHILKHSMRALGHLET